MVDPKLRQEIIKHLGRLSVDPQRRVLEFVQGLTSQEPIGISGKERLRFAGMIDPADLQEMEKAIQEACERVDPLD